MIYFRYNTINTISINIWVCISHWCSSHQIKHSFCKEEYAHAWCKEPGQSQALHISCYWQALLSAGSLGKSMLHRVRQWQCSTNRVSYLWCTISPRWSKDHSCIQWQARSAPCYYQASYEVWMGRLYDDRHHDWELIPNQEVVDCIITGGAGQTAPLY